MICDKCNYVMTDSDSECPRCHGKGIQQPAEPQQPQAYPQQVIRAGQSSQQASQASGPATAGTVVVVNSAGKACVWGCAGLLFLFVVLAMLLIGSVATLLLKLF